MKLARQLGFLLGILAVWQILAGFHLWDKTLFPAPSGVLAYLWKSLGDGTLMISLAATLRRVGIGYLISLLVGIPLGVALARFAWVQDTVGSVVSGLQSLPSLCWLPLALIWFGLNDSAILFVVVMGSLVSIAVSIRDGVVNLPPTYVQAARTMGVGRSQLVTEVLLPASLPALMTGAKLGWAYAWRSLMAGELLFGTTGLGRELMLGRDLADMSQVLGIMAVIMAVGLFTDNLIFGALESLVRERFGLDRA